MADHSAIEWTEATWNPTSGCTKVSPGCDRCYAERITRRFPNAYPNGFDLTGIHWLIAGGESQAGARPAEEMWFRILRDQCLTAGVAFFLKQLVSELVAKGEVELGMTVITQILTTTGVDLVGPLPPEIQSYITFVAGVGSQSRAPKAASELITLLGGPKATAVIKAQGMEPR